MKVRDIMEKEWGEIKPTGEWDGMGVGEIEAVADKLRAKKTRTKEESRKLKAANFAVRAKRAGGKKWKGVKANK